MESFQRFWRSNQHKFLNQLHFRKRKKYKTIFMSLLTFLTVTAKKLLPTKNGEMLYNVLLEYASEGIPADHIKKSCGYGLPGLDVKRYTKCILKGIDYIHRHGYVHCDLKPANVLLVANENGDSVAKIGDFGLAKKFGISNKKMNFDPYFGGTALYMAPETVIDRVEEPPCDIWALGCIIFEMFTGKKVWDLKPDIKTDEILKKIVDSCELPKIPGEISKDRKDFLKGCLVRKPMFRFTAEMLLDHPFLSGLDDDIGEILDEGESCDSNCCKEWSFTSEEGYPSPSWSDNVPTE